MFSQSTIVRVNPPSLRSDGLHLSWASTSPAGTWFQVYLNGALAWYGQRQYAVVPAPKGDVHIDVGTVGTGEQQTNFAGSLPAAPANRALLTWEGGAFLDPSGLGDVASFRVFGEPSPGAGVDYAAPLATIPLYTGPGTSDGYGQGGYGAGGYGSAASYYSWESDPLWSGTWTFSVAAVDREGDLGAVATKSITLAVPPREPGWRQAEPRMTYAIGAGPVAVLNWLPSPG